ncbi:hypothetical protein N452_14620 [Clostridium botulinum A2 117]|uniref:hypothetical protein n=1 Tax=Clostridium botulinum TaxID=1491 RepID=UPI0007DF1401|nr:hypothetical protein [Clostridium botulinum]KEI79753.1 hypothetical protein N452_14620 [Clostridium botulinum A2 117]MBN3416837.1 hypothetical protein [Clostridium botulinum]MBN3443328.1 hypothetical protein [Clostridium botulinum]MBY6806944.1 hypothetical protein [Clostridium botulinum]NFS07359.1 hypothetical protein [Clostridium botulinum]
MYIKVKKRRNSDKYYFYKAESYREDGKVKNKQKYITKLSEGQIFLKPSEIDKELNTLRKQDIKLFVKVLTKIQYDILKENKCTLTNDM